MTRNVFDSLLEAAARLLEKPEPPAPEPAPAPPPAAEPPPAARKRHDQAEGAGDGSDVTFANFSKDALREGTFYKVTSLPSPLRTAPEPPGLSDLPPAAREAVEPFLRHFTVTNITLIQPDAPDQPGPYGRGEQGHQTWRLRNLDLQAAEYYRRRDSGALPTEPSEPKRRAVALTPAGRVEIRRDGASRWLMFVGDPPARAPEFATPFFDHGRREAEARFGRPEDGWSFD